MGFVSQGILFPRDLIPMGIKIIPKGFDSHGNKKHSHGIRFPRDSIPKGFNSHGNKIYSQGIRFPWEIKKYSHGI